MVTVDDYELIRRKFFLDGVSQRAIAAELGIRPLTAEQRAGQRDAIRAGLRVAGAPPRLATYDVREFVY